MTESEHSWRFAATDDAPREARRKLAAWLGASHPALPTLSLLVSETVTNVLRHGRTPAELRVAETSHGVRVEVEDGNPATLHLVPDPGSAGGYGLRLVDALATTWGCARRTGGQGKTVWFEVSDDAPTAEPTR